MALRLIKTTGGQNGAPEACNRCGCTHFSRSGLAWHCSACQTYYPTSLGFETLKKHLEEAQRLSSKFKKAVDDLERIVKE